MDIALLAIKSNKDNIDYIDKKSKSNPIIFSEMLKIDPSIIKNAAKNLKDDHNLCL